VQRWHLVQRAVPVGREHQLAVHATPVLNDVEHVHDARRAVHDKLDERRLGGERLHPRLALLLVRRAQLQGPAGRRQEVELIRPCKHASGAHSVKRPSRHRWG